MYRKLLACILLIATPVAGAEPRADEVRALEQPYTVEYYYRIKWGYYEEFLELYRKNHWPVIAADMERGEILDFHLDTRRMGDAESHRWDIRATITFRNILLPHDMVDRTRGPVLERLFPDRERFEEEERRRFELIDALMIVEVQSVDFGSWPTTGQ